MVSIKTMFLELIGRENVILHYICLHWFWREGEEEESFDFDVARVCEGGGGGGGGL